MWLKSSIIFSGKSCDESTTHCNTVSTDGVNISASAAFEMAFFCMEIELKTNSLSFQNIHNFDWSC